MASLPVGGLYHHFRDILKDLWLLWELMLLAEPIVVIAPDPGVCSEAVVSLVDIINPVSVCWLWRGFLRLTEARRYPTAVITGLISPSRTLTSRVLLRKTR